MSGKTIPKAKYTLICDDIREEKANNKAILVGVYASRVLIPGVPRILPKLCLRICFDISKPYVTSFGLLIRRPNKSVFGPFRVALRDVVKETGESFLHIIFTPFMIEEAGSYDVIAESGGKEVLIHRFEVTIAIEKEKRVAAST